MHMVTEATDLKSYLYLTFNSTQVFRPIALLFWRDTDTIWNRLIEKL